jgi:hypothetical protein
MQDHAIVTDRLDAAGFEVEFGIDLAHRVFDHPTGDSLLRVRVVFLPHVVGHPRPGDTIGPPDDEDVAFGLDEVPFAKGDAVGLNPAEPRLDRDRAFRDDRPVLVRGSDVLGRQLDAGGKTLGFGFVFGARRSRRNRRGHEEEDWKRPGKESEKRHMRTRASVSVLSTVSRRVGL